MKKTIRSRKKKYVISIPRIKNPVSVTVSFKLVKKENREKIVQNIFSGYESIGSGYFFPKGIRDYTYEVDFSRGFHKIIPELLKLKWAKVMVTDTVPAQVWLNRIHFYQKFGTH